MPDFPKLLIELSLRSFFTTPPWNDPVGVGDHVWITWMLHWHEVHKARHPIDPYHPAWSKLQRAAESARLSTTEVFRGEIRPLWDAKRLHVGETVTLWKLTSTSLRPQVATQFTKTRTTGYTGILWTFSSPTGTRGVSVPRHISSEDEIVLPFRSRFRIEEIAPGDLWNVRAVEIEQQENVG